MRHNWLFPKKSRDFPGKRWINILLRTSHLIGIAGCGAAFMVGAEYQQATQYLAITLASGAALSLLSIWSNGIFLLQLRGQAILLKVALLALGLWLPSLLHSMFLAALIISGLIAHAPGNIRYFSLWHGRRLDCLY